MKAAARSVDDTLHARAVANRWISDNFPEQRKFLSHTAPTALSEGAWSVGLLAWNGKTSVELAQLVVEHDAAALQSGTLEEISAKIDECRKSTAKRKPPRKPVVGQYHEFRYGNGLEGAAQLEDASVDLLLTDPPYGISNAYICEKQVPRRPDPHCFILGEGIMPIYAKSRCPGASARMTATSSCPRVISRGGMTISPRHRNGRRGQHGLYQCVFLKIARNPVENKIFAGLPGRTGAICAWATRLGHKA